MPPKHRYCAIVEYDGTEFLGYQIQAQGRTVQGEIEKSLQRVIQTAIRIDGAGRTDAGVHATGQVIAFDASWRHSLTDLHRALNATLPPDIIVNYLRIVRPDFHPRFQALSRTYQYQIVNQYWPRVLQRRYTYHVNKPLDIKRMSDASEIFIGQQDFASFGKSPQGNNTVRHITQAEWYTKSDGNLIFRITANAFLYRMVRNIVGTLVKVGLGHVSVDNIREILGARDLTLSASPAPACGLCLIKVTYPEEL